jgi:hypothetical protein
MANPRIAEYFQKEEEKLQKLFHRYRMQSKKALQTEAKNGLKELLNQIQEHGLYEEEVFFSLSTRVNDGSEVQKQVELLRKDHESLCELISMMMKKEEEGAVATEEQEAFHVLLVNHLKREEEVVGLLDEYLTEKERQAFSYLNLISR